MVITVLSILSDSVLFEKCQSENGLLKLIDREVGLAGKRGMVGGSGWGVVEMGWVAARGR